MYAWESLQELFIVLSSIASKFAQLIHFLYNFLCNNHQCSDKMWQCQWGYVFSVDDLLLPQSSVQLEFWQTFVAGYVWTNVCRTAVAELFQKSVPMKYSQTRITLVPHIVVRHRPSAWASHVRFCGDSAMRHHTAFIIISTTSKFSTTLLLLKYFNWNTAHLAF